MILDKPMYCHPTSLFDKNNLKSCQGKKLKICRENSSKRYVKHFYAWQQNRKAENKLQKNAKLQIYITRGI